MTPTRSVSLVVTDLDGTLWHTEDHVERAVIAAIATVQESGVPLLVATGRRLDSTRRPLARIGVSLPMVVLNGALGVEVTGERFHCSPYDPAQATEVLAAFRSVGLDPVVYVDSPDVEVFISTTPGTNPDHVLALASGAGVDDLDRVVAEERVLGFGILGVSHGEGVAVVEAVGDIAETHLDRSLDFPGTASLTVAPLGQSKWDGVVAFCALRGHDPTRVLVLADGANDLELLDNAAVGLVPKVAHPAALERADHVIPAAADGGWSAVLDHLA